MHALLQTGLDSGLLESAAQLASIAGAIVLLGLLAALSAFAYKSLVGDGIRWPGDEEEDESGVTRGGDDEWKYS